ncbi:endonuclease/exonuclease/phosphatase family protein [Sanguibacter sp. HDW7]|uniref:endonuclease/exonuclease/phosphatase family protein n=1 Tax=Sanguibacter sp. HDW7 TaxID=2714931 RepID=UPI001409E3E9|nr:endonuclease/exonuclease/phosphatase family protein [Sanguibacter sp. HDW7]QIK84433.1 endonuclease/exonuclease/phosphatase family protein [Sanguibacter sp. HDW7]
MTYNLKSLALDAAAARRVVRAEAPDVLLLQETPRWLLGRRRTRAFARSVGLEVVAGGIAGRACAIAVAPHLLTQVVEGRGVAIEPRWVRFRTGWPTPRGYAYVRLARGGTLPGRVADAPSPASEQPAAGEVLTLVSVHLSAQRPSRAIHVPVYRALAAREAPDVVVGGDLNENPRGPSVLALQPPLRDADASQAPTEPADVPRTRLDGFLVGDTVTVRSVRVPDGPDVLVGSDHRPAVLELVW